MPTNFASAQRGWHASMGPRGLDSGSGLFVGAERSAGCRLPAVLVRHLSGFGRGNTYATGSNAVVPKVAFITAYEGF
jgi:hypothetical protein